MFPNQESKLRQELLSYDLADEDFSLCEEEACVSFCVLYTVSDLSVIVATMYVTA